MCGTLQFSDNREKPEYFYLEIDHNTQSFIQKLFFFFHFVLQAVWGVELGETIWRFCGDGIMLKLIFSSVRERKRKRTDLDTDKAP